MGSSRGYKRPGDLQATSQNPSATVLVIKQVLVPDARTSIATGTGTPDKPWAPGPPGTRQNTLAE